MHNILSMMRISAISRTLPISLNESIGFNLRLYALLISCLCLTGNIHGQSETGLPFITNYEYIDYGANAGNWGACEDDRGIMYFANFDGVLEYDGTNWRTIKSPTTVNAREFVKGDDGTIYVAWTGDLGYLAPDENGTLQFVSLKDRLPAEERVLQDVWSVYMSDEGIWFQTSDRLFLWADETFKVWKSEDGFHKTAIVHGKHYARIWNVGLTVMKNGIFELVPGGEIFADKRIYVLLPYDDEKILLGTRAHGLFIFDGTTIEPFKTEADRHIINTSLYGGVALPDGKFVLNCFNDAAVIIDKQGKLIQRIDQSIGLQDNSVTSVFYDSRGMLWLTLSRGLAKIDLHMPFTHFGIESGLPSKTVYNMQRFKGRLYGGTNNGVYYLDPASGQFELVRGTYGQCWNFIVKGPDLLMASNGMGAIKIVDDRYEPIRASVNYDYRANQLYESLFDSSRVYVSVQSGLSSLRYTTSADGTNTWAEESFRDDIFINTMGMQEDADGRLWLSGDRPGEIKLLTPAIRNGSLSLPESSVEIFSQAHGLPELTMGVFNIEGVIYFTGFRKNQIYRFDEEKRRFYLDKDFPFLEYTGDRVPTNFIPFKDDLGWTWVDLGDGTFAAKSTENGGFDDVSKTFKQFQMYDTYGVFTEMNEGNTVSWITGPEGVLRYEGNLQETASEEFTALIRGISVQPDSLVFGGYGQPVQNQDFKYNSNTITFLYAAPYFTSESDIQYSTYLEGLSNQWSSWHGQSEREYINLPAGNYTFKVKAKNIFGQESEEATYSFAISPPWYASWLAYVIYVLIGGALIYTFLKWRTSQLRKRGQELEQEVENRTEEIQRRIEELGVINAVQEGLVEQINMKAIYALVGNKIREVFDSQVVVINIFDHEKGLEYYRYAFEKGELYNIDEPSPIDPLRQHIIDTGKLILINKNYLEESQKYGGKTVTAGEVPKSALWVPLIVGEQVIGTVSLQNVDHENAFNDSDVKLLGTLTNSMAVALENARLFEDSNRLLDEKQQQADELAIINSVQGGLVELVEMQAIYEFVGARLNDQFDVQTVVISSFQHDAQIEHFNYATEKGKRFEIAPRAYDNFTRHIIKQFKPLLINEKFEEFIHEMAQEDFTTWKMPKSAIFVPITKGDQVIGNLSLQNVDHENAFKDSDVSLLETLAYSMSVALENARLFEESARLLDEVQLQAKELAVINLIQAGLVEQNETEAIYTLMGDKVRDKFDSQAVVINTFDHKAELNYYRYVFEEGQRLDVGKPVPLNNIMRELIKTKAPVIFNEDYAKLRKKYGLGEAIVGRAPQSAVWVPIIANEVVIGSISLQNIDHENAFSASDVKLLSSLTNIMSIALENARLFEEAEQRASEMSTVNRISQALTKHLELDQLVQLVGENMRDLFNADIAYVGLLDKDSAIIDFPYQFGDDLRPLKLGEGITSHIIANNTAILLNQGEGEEHKELGMIMVGTLPESYLGVPVPVGDDVIGVISVQRTSSKNHFDESDMHLLETIASNVGIAIHNAQLFEDAEASRAIAEDANEAKSAFLSTVSHELRTPLTSVMGFAKITKRRLEERVFPALVSTDSKMQKTIQQISDNLNVVVSEGERLTKLINNVLDLAKIEAGRVEWHMENLQVEGVINRAVAATTSLFEQKNLGFKMDIAPNIPDIMGDEDKLIQVVVNLLSNAVKFTNEGEIQCIAEKKDGDVIISVKDSGIGIAKDDLPKVFEKFRQVGDTLTDKPTGTGLGLPISKEIVEHHGGRIWLKSEIGKGSTFSFSLPVSIDGKSASTFKTLKLEELVDQLEGNFVETQFENAGEKTILVIDDEAPIRELLNQELSGVGFNVIEAADGREGIEKVRYKHPDLILLDVMMPEMNGYDVAAVLKNDPKTKHIPIIILSVVKDKERGLSIGIDRYLFKPINTDLLFREIGGLLGQGRSKRKVMIMDEDSSTVSTLMSVLQDKGYNVVEANGPDLVKKAILGKPDIIIVNSTLAADQDTVKSLRLQKGLENVLFLVYE